MYTDLKNTISDNFEMIVVGGIFVSAMTAITAIAVAAAKADAEETRQALAQGKSVIQLFGQKAII